MRPTVITIHTVEIIDLYKEPALLLALPIRDLRGPDELRAWRAIQDKLEMCTDAGHTNSTTNSGFPPKSNRSQDHLLTLKKVAIGGRHE